MSDISMDYGFGNETHVLGQVADARYTDIVTRTVSTNLAATARIGVAFPVTRDADDLMVKPVSAAGDVVTGVVVWSGYELEIQADGTAGFKPQHVLPVLYRGPIWVATSGAVTQGQLAYALTNGSGQFSASATGAASRPVGVFETSTTGAGDAILYVTPGLSAPAASA